jgi:hypothetical protein
LQEDRLLVPFFPDNHQAYLNNKVALTRTGSAFQNDSIILVEPLDVPVQIFSQKKVYGPFQLESGGAEGDPVTNAIILSNLECILRAAQISRGVVQL